MIIQKKQKPILLKKLVVVTYGATIIDNEKYEMLSSDGRSQMGEMAEKIFDLVTNSSDSSMTFMTAVDISSQQAGAILSDYITNNCAKDRHIEIQRYCERDLSKGQKRYEKLWETINKKATETDVLVLVVDRNCMLEFTPWLIDKMSGGSYQHPRYPYPNTWIAGKSLYKEMGYHKDAKSVIVRIFVKEGGYGGKIHTSPYRAEIIS